MEQTLYKPATRSLTVSGVFFISQRWLVLHETNPVQAQVKKWFDSWDNPGLS